MADSNASKVDSLAEIINTAIDIHIKKGVQNLAYNKSEIAEIVDITQKDDGWYTVWNGSTKYMAFSENTDYKYGTKVYVNIPNNDYSGQKTIIGQYKTDDQKAVFYKSPLDMYTPLSNNLVEDTLGTWIDGYTYKSEIGLLANYNKETKTVNDKQILQIFSIDDISKKYPVAESTNQNGVASRLIGYQGHKYMGISAEFKVELSEAISGDYGIIVAIEGIRRDDVTADTTHIQRYYALDTNENIIGNVYNFPVYYKQEALFNIEDINVIDKVSVGFYQGGNFYTNTDPQERVLAIYKNDGISADNGILLPDNIHMRRLDIRFGDDPLNNRDELKVYSLNGETYDTAATEFANKKNIELRWTHLDESENKTIVIDKNNTFEKIGNFKIHWYQDSIYSLTDLKAQADEQLSQYESMLKALQDYKDSRGTDTEQEATKKLIESANLTETGTSYDWYVSADNKYTITTAGLSKAERAVSSLKGNNYTTIAADTLAGSFWKPRGDNSYLSWQWNNFIPDIDKQETKVKVIVEYGPLLETGEFNTNSQDYHIAESNVLTFRNLREVAQVDKNAGFKISFDDNSSGSYPVYSGITNELLSRSDVKDRSWTAHLTDRNGTDLINGNESIYWRIPKINTMITLNPTYYADATLIKNGNDELFTKYEVDYEENYYYIKRSAVITENEAVEPTSSQKYRIAQFYNKNCVDNTIFCYVIKNNQLYQTSATMTFGQHGSSGTDYTFTLAFGSKYRIDESDPNNENKWEVVGGADTALTIGDTDYLEITFDLFNSKNEPVNLTTKKRSDIINLWTTFNSQGYYAGEDNAQNLVFVTNTNGTRVLVRPGDNADNVGKLHNIVLQASVTNRVENESNYINPIRFTQFLPIHVRARGTRWILNGSDYIVYDDKGANPSYYNDVYELVNETTIQTGSMGILVDGVQITDSQEASYYPKFVSTNVSKLVPTPLYISGLSKNICVTRGLQYTFPLVIIQNKYQIPALNEWNGELQIDKNGNKILASMVGAGHKNGNNTFSGVVMGDVVQQNENGSGRKTNTGLFGYAEGAQTFSLNTDGKAYIGKSGLGRIYVDGNTGTIKSAAREMSNSQGTEFNLKENYIDIQGIGTESRVHLDVEPRSGNNGTGAYFSIDSNNGNRLMHVANNSYYLQTDNYSDSAKTGLKIDLANGVLNSYNKVTINGALGSSINFGGDEGKISLGIDNNGKGYLTSTGKLTITGDANSSINFGQGKLVIGGDGSLSSTGKLTITGDSDSKIEFGSATNGYRFKVDGSNGKLTLCSLDFVDDNGTVKNGGVASNIATNIKPKWKTFVTDVQGAILKENAPVTVTVKDTKTVDTSYSYTYSAYTPVELSGYIQTYKPDSVTGALPEGWSSSSNLTYSGWYDTGFNQGIPDTEIWQNDISITGVAEYQKEEKVNVPRSVDVTLNGTGSTTVKVVSGIKLKITKISMWALTNDSAVAQTGTIPVYEKGTAEEANYNNF